MASRCRACTPSVAQVSQVYILCFVSPAAAPKNNGDAAISPRNRRRLCVLMSSQLLDGDVTKTVMRVENPTARSAVHLQRDLAVGQAADEVVLIVSPVGELSFVEPDGDVG